MKIAFLKGTGIIDRLIQIWTLSKYSHCEIVFSDGTTFGNSLVAPFRTQISHKTYSPKYWDLVDVNIAPEQENLIRAFCWTQVDKKYDWKAIFFSQILPFGWEDPNKSICSEICVTAFQLAGFFISYKASKVSPGKFRKLIKNLQ
jgi:hypothetical protein